MAENTSDTTTEIGKTVNKRAIVCDPREIRKAIQDKLMAAIKSKFPVVGKNYTAKLLGLSIKTNDLSHARQRDLLIARRNCHDNVYGDIEIIDNETGKKVADLPHTLLMGIPHYTNRFTMMLDGNEYSIVSQMRTKSGVYTRKRGNDELESAFNLARGANFKLIMDPETGVFKIDILNSVMPAVAVLKILGATSEDVSNHIGHELTDKNYAELTDSRLSRARDTLYNKLVLHGNDAPKHLSDPEKDAAIRNYFSGTKIDPEVTKITLGAPHESVTASTILAAMKKILAAFNGESDFDERDMLEFQKIHTVEDLLSEAIEKSKDISSKMLMRLNKFNGSQDASKKVFTPEIFTTPVSKFITGSSLSRLPAQINPIEFLDSASIVTRLGEGAISNERAVPFETRQVNLSYTGIIDPIAAPESFKIGIDNHCTLGAIKGSDNEFYKKVKDCKSGIETTMRAIDLYDKYVGFPDPGYKKDLNPSDDVAAIYRGKLVHVRRDQLDYQIPSPHDLSTTTVNTIPFMNANQGNRLLMGAKHVQQALPLKDPEKRLVKPVMEKGHTYRDRPMNSVAELVGNWTIPRAPHDGIVTKITDDFVYIKGADGSETPVDYENNVPLATKTFLNNDLTVKVGDRVTKNQPLGGSNFTRDGELTMGRNLTVAYMPYEGLNHEDGLVVSEECAKKMTSVHSDKVSLRVDKTITCGKDKFAAAFPARFTKEQLAKLDSDGLAKKGEILENGDPVIVALGDNSASRANQVLGNLHKALRHPYKDISEVYEGAYPAEVIGSASTHSVKTVSLKIEKPLQIGDKLSGSYGNKGTCAKILPSDQMPKDENGNPVDMVFSSVGVISRINAGQILEGSLGKVSKKTGNHYDIENFGTDDYVKFVKDELKKNGVKDKETVFDPVTGKKIPNVFVGVQHYHKLFKTTDTNFAARGIDGGYDQDESPSGSGLTGPKALGNMEVNALVAHNARAILREGTMLRSGKNLEFWKEFQNGGNPRMPSEKKAFSRFAAILKQAGINVKKEGSNLVAGPMTDKDVLELSSGEIKDALRINAKSLQPEPGGLFDPHLTGGLNGDRWTHIKLVEPVVNPIFKDAAKSVLGLDSKAFEEMAIKEGGGAIRKALNAMDVEKELENEENRLYSGDLSRNDLDKTIKRVKYLKALKETQIKPGEAYTLSVVPVLPPKMRPLIIGATGDTMDSDANALYRDLILQNQAFQKIKNLGLTEEEVRENRKSLQKRMNELAGLSAPESPNLRARSVKGAVAFLAGDVPKEGYFQSKVIYGKMNLSGRATISPDNTLGMDEVGIPETMAWEMYKPFISRQLSQLGYSPLKTLEAIEEKSPVAIKALHDEMEKRPVLVNRAPTLWRHGILAARPVLRDGKNLRINSLWETGLNADYDGDAMQIHLPVSDEAVKEAYSFLPSKQAFSDKKRGDILTMPKGEPVLGFYKVTENIGKPVKGSVHRFKNVDEAWKAYHAGKLKMTDLVEIG